MAPLARVFAGDERWACPRSDPSASVLYREGKSISVGVEYCQHPELVLLLQADSHIEFGLCFLVPRTLPPSAAGGRDVGVLAASEAKSEEMTWTAVAWTVVFVDGKRGSWAMSMFWSWG